MAEKKFTVLVAHTCIKTPFKEIIRGNKVVGFPVFDSMRALRFRYSMASFSWFDLDIGPLDTPLKECWVVYDNDDVLPKLRGCYATEAEAQKFFGTGEKFKIEKCRIQTMESLKKEQML